MSVIRITLQEMPPSANGMRSHFIKDGKVVSVKSKEYARWKKEATWLIAAQRPGKIEGPYRLSIEVQRNWRTKRARDIDNLIKPISDALVSAGVIQDDSLAERVSAEWADDLEGAAVFAVLEVA